MDHWWSVLALAGLLGCAASTSSQPPNHEALVNEHMKGNYAEVLRWCPMILDDPGADPVQSDWCLFGYPAALRLSLDTDSALLFMRTVCTDLAGHAVGKQSFREFYVREVARWFALPMRLQNQDALLPRAVEATVADFSAACLVDPETVGRGLDTRLGAR